VYLRAENPRATWEAVANAAGIALTADPDIIVVGDWNTNLTELIGRTTADSGPAPELDTRGLAPLAPDEPTCNRGRRHRTLDGALVPLASLPYWTATAQWKGPSDHAAVVLKRTTGTPPRGAAAAPRAASGPSLAKRARNSGGRWQR
jgi:hypothetical protein